MPFSPPTFGASAKYTADTVKGMGAIKGDKGDPGIQGPPGPKGDKGDPGVGADINIEDIKDVNVADTQNNDTLVYDEETKTWVNKSMPFIPTKTSDLTNDAKFVTEDDLSTRLATDLENIDEAGVDKIKEIVGKTDTSDIEKTIADNWNGTGHNLIPFPYYDETIKSKDGITYTALESGEVLAVGTGTSNLAYYLTQAYTFPAGTYRLSGCPAGGSDTTYYQYIQNADSGFSTLAKDSGDGSIFTLDTETRLRIGLYVITGYDVNITFKPMITKVAEDGSYPTEYQRYASGNVELTDEISRKELELAELKMLGWNVPKECPIQNEVSGNTFTQRVGRVDLGPLDWTYNRIFTQDTYKCKPSDESKKANIYCAKYNTESNVDVFNRSVTGISINDEGNIRVNDPTYTDANTFKTAMNGQYLYYELETPITKQIEGNEVIKQLNDSLVDNIGDLSKLETEAKTDLVSAINEIKVHEKISGEKLSVICNNQGADTIVGRITLPKGLWLINCGGYSPLGLQEHSMASRITINSSWGAVQCLAYVFNLVTVVSLNKETTLNVTVTSWESSPIQSKTNWLFDAYRV